MSWRVPVDMTTTVDLVKKICLMGDSGVGKTSLIRRFVLDVFDDSYTTTIGAKVTKKPTILYLPERDLQVNLGLIIWDVAGQRDYKMFHEVYLKGMEGALVVADLSRQNTFSGLKSIMTIADRAAANVPMIFLMNKCDLAEPSPDDLKDVRTLASQRGIPVLATSAKTGMNVELAFNQLGRKVVENWLEKKEKRAAAEEE